MKLIQHTLKKILNSKNSFLLKSFSFSMIFTLIALVLSSAISWGQTIVTLTSGSTWIVPANVYSINVEVIGGGGGGSFINSNTSGGGGGGGAYASKIFCVTPGTSYSYSVGAGGSGGSGASGAKNGGDTWFNNPTILLAKGGLGVSDNFITGAAGGQASQSVGDVKYNGGNGGDGAWSSGSICGNEAAGGGGGGAGRSIAAGGNGANGTATTGTLFCAGNGSWGGSGGTSSSPGGSGGSGGAKNIGNNGSSYGGGGGGAARISGSGSYNGGNGAQGIIRITYTTLVVDAGVDQTISCGGSAQLGSVGGGPLTVLASPGTPTFPSGVESIRRVVFNTINNNSNNTNDCHNGEGAFQDFTSTHSTTVVKGSTYSLQVYGNTCGNYTAYQRVYFDWNRDGDFLDAGESIDLGTYINNNNGSTTTNITIPTGAALGAVRMRIVKRYITYGTWNNNEGFGQAEDYTVIITDGVTYTWTPTTGLSNPNISNPIASPTATTTYTLTATAGGCSATDNVTVTVNQPVITGPTAICVGDTPDFGVSGASEWNGGHPTGGVGGAIAVPSTTNEFYHIFKSGTSNFIVPAGTTIDNARVLIVGGGGGAAGDVGGGGGGGAVVEQVLSINPNTYSVVVGAGGAGDAAAASGATFSAGGASSAFGYVANGGGRGGLYNNAGGNGANGGGGGGNGHAGGIGTQGFNGGASISTNYRSGGGGGAGGAGGVANGNYGGNGGPGVYKSFFSFAGQGGYFGGGGGGGSNAGATYYGSGGIGGGGRGTGRPTANVWNADNQNGLPNTGGGAGGNANQHSGGASGGSGVVIIRYQVPQWTVTNVSGSATASINSLTGVLSSVSGSGVIRVTYTTGSGCVTTLDVTVNDKPTPPTSITGNGAYCKGNFVTLTQSGGNLVGTSQYQWYTGSYGGTLVGTGSSITVSPTSSTTYYVGTSANGSCPASTSFASGAVSMPTPSGALASSGESKTCVVNAGETVEFYETSTGNYITTVTAGATSLGSTTATAYVDLTNQLIPACDMPQEETAVMQRHWVINPTVNGPATVRLPYTSTELSNLATASVASSSPHDLVVNPNQNTVFLSKYSGPANVNANALDNCPAAGGNGNTTIHTNNGVGSTPAIGVTAMYSDFAITGFSEFWLHGSTNASPLAVDLASFGAECNDKTTRVEWLTASEINTSHFVLERSRNGYDWTEVAQVEAQGNSTNIHTYAITDAQFGSVYYRLIQTDKDGKSTVFGPIYADCHSTNNEMIVYPNPNQGNFTVAVSSSDAVNGSTITVKDLNGKVIASKIVDLHIGVTSVQFTEEQLVRGTYFVTIENTAGVYFAPVKLIVQ